MTTIDTVVIEGVKLAYLVHLTGGFESLFALFYF